MLTTLAKRIFQNAKNHQRRFATLGSMYELGPHFLKRVKNGNHTKKKSPFNYERYFDREKYYNGGVDLGRLVAVDIQKKIPRNNKPIIVTIMGDETPIKSGILNSLLTDHPFSGYDDVFNGNFFITTHVDYAKITMDIDRCSHHSFYNHNILLTSSVLPNNSTIKYIRGYSDGDKMGDAQMEKIFFHNSQVLCGPKSINVIALGIMTSTCLDESPTFVDLEELTKHSSFNKSSDNIGVIVKYVHDDGGISIDIIQSFMNDLKLLNKKKLFNAGFIGAIWDTKRDCTMFFHDFSISM